MGLSSEERMRKYYYCMIFLRKKCIKLVEYLKEIHSKTTIVEHWIRTIDKITGQCIIDSDKSGCYWLIGPNKDNFKSLWSNTYDLGHIGTIDKFDIKVEYNSYLYWEENTSLVWFATKLTSGNFDKSSKELAIVVANLWEIHSCVEAALYPICRYDDNLFSSIKEDFTVLIGEMANLRYSIANDYNGDVEDVEQALLCKYNVFQYEFIQAGKKIEYEDQKEKDFDINEIVDNIGKMSLVEVKNKLEEIEKDKMKERDQRDQENDKSSSKINGIFGPKARDENELINIIDNSTNKEEYEKARHELEHAYSSYYGIDWDELVKKYPNASKIGMAKAFKEAKKLEKTKTKKITSRKK